MKKLVTIFMVLFLVVGCSSDDNKQGDDGQSIKEGISNSTKIKTPSWLHGEWVAREGGLTSPQSFRVQSNDLCVVLNISSCYQGIIDQTHKVNSGYVQVEQEYKNGYYRLTMSLVGTTTEYVFTKKAENEVVLQMGNLKTTLIRK